MAGKPKPAAERTATRSVSLRPADWLFLEGLGAEVGYREATRGTTSEAIRHLIAEEQKRRGRVETHHDGQGNLEYQEAIFEVGVGEGGGALIRRLNLQTGQVYHMVRTQDGPFTVERQTKRASSRPTSPSPSVSPSQKKRR